MINSVGVVSAFLPLKVKHMSADRYEELGTRMLTAAHRAGAIPGMFRNPIETCWSYDLCTGLPPATETPADRYATPEDHVRSHIVQHTRTQWALELLASRDLDVIVWLDYGILKQGDFTGKPVTEDDVSWFVEAVQMHPFQDIPFPGITGPEPWLPHGNNWRFCGSTHVWPTKWLEQIDRSYKANLIKFVRDYKSVPLDLAIWPLVERTSGLPFKWYQAEYDNTQLRNFPCAL